LAELTLEQKEYLSEKQAAEYCCVSLSHFHRERAKYGIPAIRHMGKKLYRMADLRASIEKYAPK